MNKSNRVLVVEDDAAIVRALSSFLTDEGFCAKAQTGRPKHCGFLNRRSLILCCWMFRLRTAAALLFAPP